MSPYQAVLFDIDDTLIDFRRSETLSLKSCYDHFFKSVIDFASFANDYSRINRALWNQAEEGIISTAIIGTERFKQLTAFYDTPYAPDIPQHYEREIITHSAWIEGASDFLHQLKEKRIEIAYVTNGFAHMQRAKYLKLDLKRFSDILVISEEVGFSKPHPTIFLHALSHIQKKPEEVLMIGDSLSSDGEGARKLNIPFCWFNPKKNPNPKDWQPVMTLSSFSEFELRSLLTIQ
jgi:YjjG family noncanonical pyrimidine nucleotidase